MDILITILTFVFTTPTGLAGLVTAGASFVLGKIIRDKVKQAIVEKVVSEAIPIAYHVVNEISRRTQNKIDDKVAEALKIVADYVKTKGVDPAQITDAQKERAKFIFDSLHAQEKQSEKTITIIGVSDEAFDVPEVKA